MLNKYMIWHLYEKNMAMSIFEKILDRDGDGSIMDDIAQIGFKSLGNLFKR